MEKSEELQAPQGKYSLAYTIDLNYVRLENSFACFESNGTFGDFEKEIMRKINDGEITDDTMSDSWIDVIKDKPDSHLLPFFHSCIYSILAQRAHERGESDKGWSFVAQSSYLAGVASNVSIDKASLTVKKKQVEDARKGGLARSAKINLAKVESIRLLKDERPNGGWVDVASAIDGIKSYLAEFIRAKSINITKENLPANLKKWLLHDFDVSAAFDANSVKTILKSR